MATMVLLAGGSGDRVGAERNKVLLPVAGRPLVDWSLLAFQAASAIERVIVVARPDDLEEIARIAQARSGKLAAVVPGGTTRHRSEQAGLAAVAELDPDPDHVVAFHDAARPLVSVELIDRVLDAVGEGGAWPAVPLRVVEDADGFVIRPPFEVYRAQTPQAFRYDVLIAAFDRAARDGYEGTDTVATVQRLDTAVVRAVAGDPANLKVTVASDLDEADRVLSSRPE